MDFDTFIDSRHVKSILDQDVVFLLISLIFSYKEFSSQSSQRKQK